MRALERLHGRSFFIAIALSVIYNGGTMQLPFEFNRYTFSGIFIGIVLVALTRAYFGF